MSTIISADKHRRVLKTCVDVPEQKPSFAIPLQQVGISGKTIWVRLAGNRGGHLPFNAGISVDLPASRRGIHMSRIEQAVTDLHDREFNDLDEYARELAERVLKTQNACHAVLEMKGRMPFSQQAPVSRLTSIDTIEVSLEADFRKNDREMGGRIKKGVGVYHLTACPCTMTYNEVLFDRANDPWPQATHSQRSMTEILVTPPSCNDKSPSYEELVSILDKVLHVSQDLLKRSDETELVLKAHRSPQFAEDTVREVARAAGEKLVGSLPADTEILVRSLSLESIHIHDVRCSLETTLGEILAVQAAEQRSRTNG